MSQIWFSVPVQVHLFIFAISVLFFLASARFARLGLRLYRYTGDAILPEKIINGTVDPNHLAAFALASRLLCKRVLPKCMPSEAPTKGAGIEKAILMFHLAESRFSYLWEISNSDVESGKRTSLVVLLLSVAMVGFDAFGPFLSWLEMAEQLVRLLAIGTLLAALIYFMSSFFERSLSKRNACWKYFCSRLKNDLIC